MQPSRVLLSNAAKLTLFTRANCSLCDVAKSKIIGFRNQRTVEYDEIDVMAPGQRQWKKLYQFDTPVLHVDRATAVNSSAESVSETKKLWHRFSVEDIEKLVDEIEQQPA